MKVVILAGGYGTRLSEETSLMPKPMIEIGGRPLLWHLMKIFSTQGYNEFIVALGYKGNVIKQYFLNFPQLEADLTIDLADGSAHKIKKNNVEWKIDLIDTGTDTMTGGRLKRLRERLDDTFIFTYGDGLSNIDVNDLVAFHRGHGRLATVTAVPPTPRFGLLQLNGNQVNAFNEKRNSSLDWINGGYFVLEPDVIDYIDGDDTPWERAPCERLAREEQLMAYRHHGYWQCVDTLHELRLLRDAWNGGHAHWKIWP